MESRMKKDVYFDLNDPLKPLSIPSIFDKSYEQQPHPPPIISYLQLQGQSRSPYLPTPLSASSIKQLQDMYNHQIQKLNQHINQLNDLVARSQVQIVRRSNQSLQKEKTIVCLRGQIQQYRSTLQNMYMLVEHKDKQNYQLKQASYLNAYQKNQNQLHYFGVNPNHQNQINNLILDRDILGNKLSQEQQKYMYDMQSLVEQLHMKNQEIHQLRKRLSEIMDAKRRLQQQLSAQQFLLIRKFANQNLKSKLESQIKELKLRMENMDRSFNQTLQNKLAQINNLESRLKDAEHKNKMMAEDLEKARRDKNAMQHQLNMAKKDASQSKFQRDRLKEIIKKNQEEQFKPQQNQRQDLQQKKSKLKTKVINRGFPIDVSDLSDQKQTIYRYDQKQINTLIPLLQHTRNQILDYIFQLFCRSIDSATTKKQNSLILFIINLKEIKQKTSNQLQVVMDNYKTIRMALKNFLQYPKVQLVLGRGIQSEEPRDNINQWVEGTLVYTIEQKRKDLKQKNRFYLYLFRLLTIRYRIIYPLKGSSMKLDLDLDAALNHKIVYALRKVFQTYQ